MELFDLTGKVAIAIGASRGIGRAIAYAEAGARVVISSRKSEIAGAAVFLASWAGAYVTGQGIVVDGGTTVQGGR